MRTLFLSVAPNAATRELSPAEVPFEDLGAAFANPEVGSKDGEAFIPAEFSTPERRDENVIAITALCVDLDHRPPGDIESILEALKQRRIAFFWANTHSHNPPSDNRARILIPFAEKLPLVSPAQWSKGAWPALVKALGLEHAVDPHARNPSRLYFSPRKPSESSPHTGGFVDGDLFDWRAHVGHALDSFKAVAQMPEAAAPEDTSRPVDLEEIRSRLLKKRKPLVERLARGQALAPPPSQRPQGGLPRKMAWWHALGSLSLAAEDWMSSEALLELCRPSWGAEVKESDGDYTPWEYITKSLAQQRASAPKKRAEVEAARTAERKVWELVFSGKMGLAPPDDDGESFKKPGSGGANPGEPESHPVRRLKTRKGKDGVETLDSCALNCAILLAESPELRERLSFNELSRQYLLDNKAINDQAITRLQNELTATFGTEFRWQDVKRQALVIAESHPFDPLVQYLNSLKWDGVPRVESWLETYLEAITTNESGEDITGYVRLVGRYWLIGAVARGLEPGCKMENVLHLHGTGSLGKSDTAKILGGDWFSDEKFDLDSKDNWSSCGQKWIIELGEGVALLKSDPETQKGFFSRQYDRFRPPYGAAMEELPRRCVFLGTTNNDRFFTDPTGNRRHWVVSCRRADKDALKRDRDQIFAEAVALYRAQKRWYPVTDEEKALIAKQEEDRMIDDPLVEALEDWLLRKAPEDRPTKLRKMEICSALGINTAQYSGKRINDAIQRAKFTRHRDRFGYYFEPPARLKDLPRLERKVTPTPVAEKVARA